MVVSVRVSSRVFSPCVGRYIINRVYLRRLSQNLLLARHSASAPADVTRLVSFWPFSLYFVPLLKVDDVGLVAPPSGRVNIFALHLNCVGRIPSSLPLFPCI